MESRWQDADDRHGLALEPQCLPDGAIGITEVPHGEAFTNQRHGVFRSVLVARNQAARGWLELKDVREPGICAVRRGALGLAASLDRKLAAGVACRGSERRRFGYKIRVVTARDVPRAIRF